MRAALRLCLPPPILADEDCGSGLKFAPYGSCVSKAGLLVRLIRPTTYDRRTGPPARLAALNGKRPPSSFVQDPAPALSHTRYEGTEGYSFCVAQSLIDCTSEGKKRVIFVPLDKG